MFKWIRRCLFFLLVILCILGGIVFLNGYQFYQNTLEKQSLTSKIEEIRSSNTYVHIQDLPDYYKEAVVSVEDHRFYDHGGIDIVSIGRAIVSNIRQGEFAEGGSTITQQVAKNLYFITEDNVVNRKIAEILVGFDLENQYTKEDILELYVNTIYFGDGYYGIAEASQGYFGTDAKDMNFYECTLLAGVPNAPSVYAPTKNLDLALNRQQKVIRSMIEYTDLTEEEANQLFEDTKPKEGE